MSCVCFYFAMICGPSLLPGHWQPCPYSQAEEFIFVHMLLGQVPGTDGQAGFPFHIPTQRAPPFTLSHHPCCHHPRCHHPRCHHLQAQSWLTLECLMVPQTAPGVHISSGQLRPATRCMCWLLTYFLCWCPFSCWPSLTTSSVIKLSSRWQQQSIKCNTASFWECAFCVTVKLHTQRTVCV